MKLRDSILHQKVPSGHVALWWLGQNGWILKSPGGKVITLDPYLTNACKAVGAAVGLNFDRLVPPPLAPRDLAGLVDAYVMTHGHEDHLDPETLRPYRAAGGQGPFVAPPETCEKLRKLAVPDAEIQMIWPNKEFPCGDITVRGTFAIPFGNDDMTHMGFVVKIKGGPVIYFTGDTRYHEVLASSDSLAWSFDARYTRPYRHPECRENHAKCNNCPTYALAWRERVLALVNTAPTRTS